MGRHQTAIDPTNTAKSHVSLSVARDFYLTRKQGVTCDMSNEDGHYAMEPIQKGTVIVWLSDMPDYALPRSKDPNCVALVIHLGYEYMDDALVALRDVEEGEWLTVAPSDEEEEGSGPSYADSRQSKLTAWEWRVEATEGFNSDLFVLFFFMLAFFGLRKLLRFEKAVWN